ncbi:MAG: galactose-1-phosphate uridylyltransferase [Candidatus Moranbacteria bacterium]|nr:galactose-1-phosphate uridylyltransferase [Candidatus Moranbacteria bacterium]
MPQIRKDYVLNRYVIIAQKRFGRPYDFSKSQQKKKIISKNKTCFFCPGNEEKTPPEISRIKAKDKDWQIRVFPNKFPAVIAKGSYKFKTKDKILHYSNAFGYQEVIVETPVHSQKISDLNQKQILQLLKIYADRIRKLSQKKGIKYVSVFKNQGKEAGASLEHTHTQVAAYNLLPSIIEKKEKLSKNKCPYCEVIKVEKNSPRKCFENNSFLAFTPFASRFAYEIWLMPKKHIINFEQLDETSLKDLAEIFKKIIEKIDFLNISYNFFIQYGIKNMHLQIIFIPRVSNWGGFEFGPETVINTVSPENAAKYYKSVVNQTKEP